MKKHTLSEKKELLKQIDDLRSEKGLTIQKACTQVGICNVSYYNWKRQVNLKPEEVALGTEEPLEGPKPLPPSKIQDDDQRKILEIKASFPHMGVKQLRQHLIRNHKLTYSERQVRQLLKSEGVPQIRPAHNPQPVRRFERDQPNEMWQVDIMSFHVGHKALYLTSFLDDHSRFIISYSVTEKQTSEVVLDLLRRSISFRKPLSIITDRGIQFCSWNGVTAFQLKLNALNVDHLQASEQHPQTMGKIEAFHKTIQRELLTTTEFSGTEEAKLRIHDYIMFYNFARPHMGIDNQAPAERYFKNLLPYNHESLYYRWVNPYPGTQGERKGIKQATKGATRFRAKGHQGPEKGDQGFKEKRTPARRRD